MDLFVWISISGVDLTSSMCQYTLVDTNIQFTSSSYILTLTKDDFIEIMFYSKDPTVTTSGTPLFGIKPTTSSIDTFQIS